MTLNYSNIPEICLPEIQRIKSGTRKTREYINNVVTVYTGKTWSLIFSNMHGKTYKP